MRYLKLLPILFLLGCAPKITDPFANTPRYKPLPGSTWYWQLQGKIQTHHKADIYNIDMFDSSPELITTLHNQNKKVICYINVGAYEEWREDAHLFDKTILGNKLDGWEGEQWLDIRSASTLDIMKKRFDLAKEKGCDALEVDNIDAYGNDSGFSITQKQQAKYNIRLATLAHERGLSIGLKNSLELVPKLEPYFDFAINEQCYEYNECDKLIPFIKSDKPVFIAEYKSTYITNKKEKNRICKDSKKNQFYTLILPLKLNGKFLLKCD